MAVTAKEQGLGIKPTMLAVVFVFLALFHSSTSLLDAVYVVHYPFGATVSSVIANRLQILLVRAVAPHCCSYGQHESGHFSKEHPY